MAKVVNFVSEDFYVNVLIQFLFQCHCSAEFWTNIATSHKWDAMQHNTEHWWCSVTQWFAAWGVRLAIEHRWFSPRRCTVDCDLGQVVHTHCLCHQAIRYQRALGVSRHAVRHIGPVSMVLQFLIGAWLRATESEISAALYGPNSMA